MHAQGLEQGSALPPHPALFYIYFHHSQPFSPCHATSQYLGGGGRVLRVHVGSSLPVLQPAATNMCDDGLDKPPDTLSMPLIGCTLQLATMQAQRKTTEFSHRCKKQELHRARRWMHWLQDLSVPHYTCTVSRLRNSLTGGSNGSRCQSRHRRREHLGALTL